MNSISINVLQKSFFSILMFLLIVSLVGIAICSGFPLLPGMSRSYLSCIASVLDIIFMLLQNYSRGHSGLATPWQDCPQLLFIWASWSMFWVTFLFWPLSFMLLTSPGIIFLLPVLSFCFFLLNVKSMAFVGKSESLGRKYNFSEVLILSANNKGASLPIVLGYWNKHMWIKLKEHERGDNG